MRDLAVYRNASLPRAARNWQSVAPVSMSMLLPVQFGTALLVFNIDTDIALSGPAFRFVLLGGAGYFLLSLAVISVLLFRPPRALVPRWVRDDDARIGYNPPSPGWFDWVILTIVGVPAFLVGSGTILAAVEQLVRAGP